MAIAIGEEGWVDGVFAGLVVNTKVLLREIRSVGGAPGCDLQATAEISKFAKTMAHGYFVFVTSALYARFRIRSN